MRKDILSTIGRRIALLIIAGILLIACVDFAYYIYDTTILPDKQAKATYQKTTCVLISKKLTTHSRVIHRYRADFLISYNVNGVQYNRWVSGNGLDESFSQSAADENAVFLKYEIGSSYPCWYDPSAPQFSFLVLRHNWVMALQLIIPVVISIALLYLITKILFQFFVDKLKVSTPKKIRSKKSKK